MSDWIIRLIEQSGYLGIGFLMFLETLFPPIPSELIMPLAGVAAAHGVAFVFVARVLPTVRTLVSIPAGLLDMRFRNFVIASTAGTAIWTTILATAGYKLRENFTDIERIIEPVSNAVLVTLVGAYVWRLITRKGQSS
jgi:membrane protein DedA with SNARE-associated domain